MNTKLGDTMKQTPITKKLQTKKLPQGGDLPTAEAMKLLKEKILEEVRLCSNGRKVTVYELFEMGKELLVLESELEAQTPSSAELAAEF